jgi:hypothetical protein
LPNAFETSWSGFASSMDLDVGKLLKPVTWIVSLMRRTVSTCLVQGLGGQNTGSGVNLLVIFLDATCRSFAALSGASSAVRSRVQ